MRTRNATKRRKLATVDWALFNDDILFHVSLYLDERGMTALAKTCKHFGLRSNTNTNNNNCSLMEDIARRIVNKEMTDEERAAFIRYVNESWISACQQVLNMRSPLVFVNKF